MPSLVEQPTPAPTRKWTAARIAELAAAALSIAAIFGLDLGDEVQIEALAGAVGLVVTAAGGIVSYFTKNRAV